MAMKRCPICGEKFSDTYRDCPFCEEEDALRDGEEIRRYPRKGKRTAHGKQFNIITPMLLILIFIMAALLVYLLFGDKIAEKVGKGEDETKNPPIQNIEEDPSGSEEEPEGSGTMPEDPDTTEDPLPVASDYEVTMKLPDGISLSTTDFSLRTLGESHTIQVTGGGNGTYSWVSEDDGIASVDQSGKVVAVSNGTVNVVVTDGNKKGVCIVRVKASGTTPQPSTGDNEPSATLKAGDAKVVNAGNGVRVRSGPSTNHEILATLPNGASVKVVESAGDGWYSITFSGMGGVTTPGYMKGDYLQNK